MCFLFLITQIKKAQQKISMVLESKGINFEIVDIAASAEDKDKMRELVGDPTALPPQIVNDGVYCGVCIPFLLSPRLS